LRVAKEVEDVGFFYGQELNRTTYNLARMNMILHDVHFSKFDIKQADTLEEPQHKEMELKLKLLLPTHHFLLSGVPAAFLVPTIGLANMGS